MRTINKFTESDLDTILGLPLIELCEDFTTFSPSNLGFSVEKRTKILSCVHTPKDRKNNTDNVDRYFLGSIGEPIIESKRLRSASEMVDKLNNSERWYRLATTEELRYIFMKLFSWVDDIKVYEKMK